MAFICSSARLSQARIAARSAAEGAALAAAGAAGAWLLLKGTLRVPAVTGLAAAWALSSLSVLALALARGETPVWFWRAFGLGAALRAAGLLGLIAWLWKEPWQVQASGWCAYALGVLLLLQMEYRNLVRRS